MNVAQLRRLVLLAVLSVPLLVAGAQDLELHFIDVGQGDAVLVRAPTGQSVLYDGGRGPAAVSRHLDAVGVEHLDLVVASHADADHIGGLAEVVARLRPGYFMDNGVPHTTDAYARLLDAVADAGSAYLEPTARTVTLGDVTLHVLPPPGDPGAGQNDNSVGLLVAYGDFRAALTGDAEAGQFGWWDRHHPELLTEVHVYKSSHHGSRDGDTPLSVDRFRPEVVVIGVGADNPYEHPSEWARRLYDAVGADVLRTDLHGTITVRAAPDGTYAVATERDRPDAPAARERAADPSRGTGEAVIACILFDPDGRDDGREVVTIEAVEDVDVSGWTLVDAAGHTFALPSRSLRAGEALEIPNPGRPVWNNDGDEATLRAPHGIVDAFSYGGSGGAACR